MVLESVKHAASSFVTLTYAPKFVPFGGTLVPSDPQLWLKRFRKVVSPVRIRYFLVGEYGDVTFRPHYHLALFGVGCGDVFGNRVLSDVVRDTWGLGHTMVGDLTRQSAGYVAGYVTKKMTAKDDSRLGDRYPEFARMSLRPGIGAGAMVDVAAVIQGSDSALDDVVAVGDVPRVLHEGRKSLPLGRYLRGKVREQLGFGSTKVPLGALEAFGSEMRFVLQAEAEKPENAQKTIGKIVVDMNAQKCANLEAKAKIFAGRKSL